MSQRTAKVLKVFTSFAIRLLMALSPTKAERTRCWAIAGMVHAPWQRNVALHLIAAGVSEQGARAEMESWEAEYERIRQAERLRITSILTRAEVSQGRLASKLIDDDVDLATAVVALKRDREMGQAVDGIFTEFGEG